MLINDLIIFHKEKLSNWNLIFKHIKLEIVLVFSAVIISAILMVIGFIIKFFTIFFIFLALYVSSLIYVSKRMKKVVSKKHPIKVEKGWEELSTYKVKQIKIFLKERNTLSKERVKELKEYIDKEAESVKQANYVTFGIPGLFLALLIPAWNHFNSWYFSKVVASLQNGMVYIILVSFGIIILSFNLASITNLYRDIAETRYRRLKELVNFVFCKRKVQRFATRNAECCHPIYLQFF